MRVLFLLLCVTIASICTAAADDSDGALLNVNLLNI